MPVVEATAIESAASESKTIVTRLPAEPDEPEPEQRLPPLPSPSPSSRPSAASRLRRRKQPAETGAADPWEA